MNNSELVNYFNLSAEIDYGDLNSRLSKFLASDADNKVGTLIDLINVVSELNWKLFQYKELLSSKSYSELYSSIISAYSLNSKLGKVPTELIQLDIKLRSITNTSEVKSLVDKVFISLLLNLIKNFSLDDQLFKLLNVILAAREICLKYHNKVKLTLAINKFKSLKFKYRNELQLFGFNSAFTEAELKSKWRELAMKYHPDKNGGDGSMFIKCRDAYNTLLKIFEE